MVTNKALVIAKDIDIARCKGNWQALPELARRYKKHNPPGIVLEQSILAEVALNQILVSHRLEPKHAFLRDSPHHVTLPKRLDLALMKQVQHQLAIALGDKDTSSDTVQMKQIARVILAQTWFECGEYRNTLDTLQEVELNTNYSFIAQIQSLAMKAMSFELLEMKDKALDAYADMVSFINSPLDRNLMNERLLVEWAEDGLYRGTLYALNEGHLTTSHTMDLIRAYQKTCSSQLNNWRVYKRLVVTRNSLTFLSSIYRGGDYLPPVDYRLTEEGKQMSEADFPEACQAYHHQLFSIEIMQLHTVYEKLVYSIAHFPKSGQMNALVLDFVDQLAADFALVGGTETEKRGYVEALNRASLRTFNSPCVTRHLFHALVNLGDYEEAEHALRIYLYLIGLESPALLDSRIAPLASDVFGAPLVPDEIEELAVAEASVKIDDPQQREEVVADKINVLSVAVQMYCNELGRGVDAVTVAELAYGVYKLDHGAVLGAQVQRILGIAYGFLASQTFDPKRRPLLHEKALAALRQSLELDDSRWETHYQLALQLAEMRDISNAIPMVSKSLQMNSNHLPSWHLLALLCTCPVKESDSQALKTCELALNESQLYENWVDYSEDIAQHVLLQMTQTLLVERVHGAEEALVAQSSLFQTFGKIVVPELIPDVSSNMLHESISQGNARYGMVLSGSLGHIEPSYSSSSTEKQQGTRGRSASNASTFTTRSASSFTGRKLHLADMFNPETSSVKSVNKNKYLDPKGLMRLKNTEELGTTTTGSLTSLHSTTSSTQTLLANVSSLTRPTTLAKLQHQRSCKMLCDLWLLSAEGFLKQGKLEEASKAVSEGENVDWSTHAGVWCLLGRIRIAQKQPQKAIAAFEKGLVTKPNDVECRVWLAKTYMDLKHLDIAQGILETVTQGNGWDNPSAW
ncbi:hypothetical protein INT47_003682 [Mucor saturninus]|uniref:Uncharacterized protein n=1 Tax=Mucor saturninus TaxID=64648 RepID=A0A8H7RA73_9FUNG|nr:hypothetical protein INT47_003682 [Mucor saturninus]